MRNYFVSWFYVEPEGDDNFSPSAGGRSSSTRVQAIYWRCVYDLYKTALATNAEVVTDWIFVSNLKELPVVDGVDLNRFFADHQVKLVNVELTRKHRRTGPAHGATSSISLTYWNIYSSLRGISSFWIRIVSYRIP